MGSWPTIRLMRTALRAAPLAASAFVVIAGIGAANAQAGVTFAAGQTLKVSWSELLSGRQIEACDGGRSRAKKLKVVPAGFEFVRHKTSIVEPSAVLTGTAPASIASGSCGSLRLQGASGKEPDPGKYAGTLLLVTAGLGTARLPTIVTVPGMLPGKPSGISEELTLSIHTGLSSNKAHGVLLLKPPTESELRLKIGQTCAKELAKAKRKCDFIGNLSRNQHVVHITIDGPAKYEEKKHVQELPIALESSDHVVGDYQGSVTLASEDAEPQTIKVKLSASDSIGWAIGALVIGALIPLLLQLWEERCRPKHALERRRKAIPDDYADPAPDFPNIKVSKAMAERYAAEVKHAIKRYAYSVVLLDTKSEAYGEIEAALKLAEDDARVLSGSDGLSKALTQLQDEIDETTTLLEQKVVTDRPAVLAVAAAPLVAGDLAIGVATERAERSDELTALLRQWRQLAGRVLAHAVWLKQITAVVPKPVDDVEDARTLAYAGSQLWAVREELFKVTDKQALDEIARSAALASALSLVGYLGSRYGVAMPAADLKPTDLGGTLSDVGYPAPPGLAITKAEAVANPATVRVTPAQPVRLPLSLGILLVDVLALLLTVAIGVVTGLSAFYFGKTWGTVEDFLTVIVVGAAAQTLAKTILERLAVFLHDISPDEATKGATAKLIVVGPKS